MTDEKEYVAAESEFKFVCEQVIYYNERIVEAFNFYVKIFSAVVGGSIWIRAAFCQMQL